MIYLDKNNLLVSGSERACYIHPNDETKLIKIIHSKDEGYNQNDLEYKYYNYLDNQKVSFSNIAKCFGWIETNIGKGLLFERILNYDNSDAKEIRYYIKNNIFSDDEEKNLLNELKYYLEVNKVLFIDATTVNVLCKEISKGKYRLIIIDGLGGKRIGVKSRLYLIPIFLPYTIYKIKKQWKVFLKNIKNVKNLR